MADTDKLVGLFGEIKAELGEMKGSINSLKENLPALVREAMRDTCARTSERLVKRIEEVEGNLEPRVRKLEARKWTDTAASAGGGVIGGLLAILGKAWVWR